MYKSIVIIAACLSIGLGAGAAHAEIPEEVVIGGVFDITGNWAAEGEAGKNAAELAIMDFNKYLENIGADWSMSMRVEDSQATGSVALDKVQTLRGQGINILVGMAFSSHLSLTASYVDANNMLVLSCCSQAGNLAIDDNMFRMTPNDDNQAPAVNAMLEDAGIEVMVLVTRGDTWGDGMRDTVSEIFNGTIVDGFRYNPDAIDFSTEVALLDENIGALIEEHGAEKIGVLYVGVDEFLLIVEQMKYYTNVKEVRWFATNTQASSTLLLQDEVTINFANDIMLTATLQSAGEANHITAHVNTEMNDAYGRSPSSYALSAYDSVWVLGNAILQTNSIEVDGLVNAIPMVAEHMIGASGPLYLTEAGDRAHAEYMIMQVQDGQWIQEAQYDPVTQSVMR